MRIHIYTAKSQQMLAAMIADLENQEEIHQSLNYNEDTGCYQLACIGTRQQLEDLDELVEGNNYGCGIKIEH